MKVKEIYELHKNNKESIEIEVYSMGKLLDKFEYPTNINKDIENKEIQGIVKKENKFEIFLKIESEEDIKICSECGKVMKSGYVIGGGLEYYCSDKCLHKHYTEEEWNEMYDDEGDNYWTEWE